MKKKIILSAALSIIFMLLSIIVSFAQESDLPQENEELQSSLNPAFAFSDSEKITVTSGNDTLTLCPVKITVDINNDSKTTSADARLLLRHSAKIELYTGDTELADVTCDGILNSVDARLVLRFSASLDKYYRLESGDCFSGLCVTQSNKIMLLNEYGATADGLTTIDNSTYYCKNGYAVTGYETIDGILYGFGKDGKGLTGEYTVNGERVHFENGVSTSGYKTVNGVKLYYTNGNPADGTAVISGNTYYFSKGVMQYGWQSVKGEYYHFDRADGRLLTSTTVDGIKVDANGKAEKSSYNTEKIKTFMKARNIMLRETKPSDTTEEKKLKCFRWVMSCSYRQYRQVGASMKTPGWEMKFANDIFDNGNGCCGSVSAAFAFLAVECGAKDVYFCDDGVSTGGHAWVIMEGNNRVYDIIFAKSKSFEKNYDYSAEDYRSYVPRKTYIGG